MNGIEADTGAAEREVAGGDRIWWDYRDWSAAMRVPAVVGSFPEPFVHGSEGKRFPVRIDCARRYAATSATTCRDRLDSAGVETATARRSARPPGKDMLRVVVGVWKDVRGDAAAAKLEEGPGESGVFARAREAGRRLRASTLLDAQGRIVRTLGAGRRHRGRDALRGAAADLGGVGDRRSRARSGACGCVDARVLRDRFAVATDGAAADPAAPRRSRGGRDDARSCPHTGRPGRRCTRRGPASAAAFALAPCVAALVTSTIR